MKTRIQRLFAETTVITAILLFTPLLQSQTLTPGWSLTDKFPDTYPNIINIRDARNAAMTSDQSGNILYAAGSIVDGSGLYRAIIRTNSVNGTTWATLGNELNMGVTNTRFYTVITDQENRLYAGGIAWPESDPNNIFWLFVRSDRTDGTWDKIILYQKAKGLLAECFAMQADPNPNNQGHLYAAGQMVMAKSKVAVWTVMKSTDYGDNWNVVDATGSQSQFGLARGVAIHPNGSIFVAGLIPNKTQTAWTVRRSSDAGATWVTVDTYKPNSLASWAMNMTIDSNGNIYVVGTASLDFYGKYWIVRKSTDLGVHWYNVDIFRETEANASAQPLDILTLPRAGTLQDKIFVVGRKSNILGGFDWLVRSSLDGVNFGFEDEQIQLEASENTVASGITRDSLGNVYVSGSADTSQGGYWLVRKRILPENPPQ